VTDKTLEGRAVAFARGGDAIVESREGRVYVPNAVPGDVLRIARTERVHGAELGRIVEVITPSQDRVTAPCRYAVACGGCPMMSATLSLQRQSKRMIVSRALGREVALEHGPADVGYRRRARLAFDARASRLGYRGQRSSSIVDVDACAVLAPDLAAALAALRASLLPELTGKGEIRLARSGEGVVVRVSTDGVLGPGAYAALERMVGEGVLAGASVLAGGATKPAVIGDPRERTRAFDGSLLLGTDGGFSQANDEVNALLVHHARTFARTEGASVLELYAGHGNVTVALAPGARSYTAVELDAEAAAALSQNVADRSLDVRVLARDAALAPKSRVDVVVLDPPRTGAAEAIPTIVAACPSRIVYVSCDPATLARDVRALSAYGYVLRDAVALDMFPHTPHVETVAWMERTTAS
jgi:23S rRNA (uracil1939-C5)-methyltransferase